MSKKEAQIATKPNWRQNSVNALKCTKTICNMCKFDQYLHTLRKNVTNTSAICVSLTNTYTLWVKGVQRFSQYV